MQSLGRSQLINLGLIFLSSKMGILHLSPRILYEINSVNIQVNVNMLTQMLDVVTTITIITEIGELLTMNTPLI